MSTLFERGRAEVDRFKREEREGIESNIARGKQEIRRMFVSRFYHDTMENTNQSGAYHTLGPDSPDPDIEPACEPSQFGGAYHNVDWTFTWDDIKWAAQYLYRHEGWNLDFYVLVRRRFVPRQFKWVDDWEEVHTPAQVVRAFEG